MHIDLAIDKTLRAGARRFRLQAALTAHSERLVILGPSGAGKSLLLKTIAGLERPDHGHIRLAGTTLFDSAQRICLQPQLRHVAYVFQDYALFPHLDVRQNVGFGLTRGWRNPRRTVRDERIGYWLQALGLEHVAHQYPHELSGGQRQRTALARALASEPRALLLDEPFSALDAGLRAGMRAELDALQRRLQVPMILITHDPEDARLFGGQVLTLRDGLVESFI